MPWLYLACDHGMSRLFEPSTASSNDLKNVDLNLLTSTPADVSQIVIVL